MSENYNESAGGIYIILNVLDCKAYVGQAKSFGNRTHLDDLMKKTDVSPVLQQDYNAGKELVYFTPAIFCDPSDKAGLNKHEKIYMTLMEEFGVSIYNLNPKKENRTWKKIQVSNEDKDNYKKCLEDDFQNRFQLKPEQLVSSSKEERRKAIDRYASLRIDEPEKIKQDEFFKHDIFMFNRERAKTFFYNKIVSYKSLSLDELFLSSAGNYLGEGLDQILSYENNAILETRNRLGNGYCLWTFSNIAVSLETVRKQCRKYHAQGKETYVLFTFTPSTTYSYTESYSHPMLVPEEKTKLLDDEIDFLHFNALKRGRKTRLFVPGFKDTELENHSDTTTITDEIVNTTSADFPNTAAFVIQEFALLREQLDPAKLKELCLAVRTNGSSEIKKIKEYKRSTFYLKLKDNCSIADAFTDNDGSRKITFVGKLAAPYIIRLTGNYNK